jgi:cephalosporin hydroxylase
MNDQIGKWVDEAMDKYGPLISLQIRYEIYELAKIVENIKPNVVIEIGTDLGETLFLWGKICDGTVISIDLPNGRFGTADGPFGTTGGYTEEKIPLYKSFGKDIQLIRDDSHSATTLQKVKEILNGRQVDFLFIDGDHSYKGVSDDFLIYSPLVRKGGLIAFHDIVQHKIEGVGVSELWQQIKDTNEYWGKIDKSQCFEMTEIVENDIQSWAGIGVLKK